MFGSLFNTRYFLSIRLGEMWGRGANGGGEGGGEGGRGC